MKPPNMAPVYVTIYARACEIARERGYCLAVHGTMQRDLDVVAVPWTDEACSSADLVSALADDLAWALTAPDGVFSVTGPDLKPHGRLVWSIPYMGHWFIDISVMPRGGA